MTNTTPNTPQTGMMERVRAATKRAQQFLAKARDIQRRFDALVVKHGIVYTAGKTITQLSGGERPAVQPEQRELQDSIDRLGKLLEEFDGVTGETDRNTESASAQVASDDPVADDLAALRTEIHKLGEEAGKWRKEETESLRTAPESSTTPSEFGASRVSDMQRLVDALLRWEERDSASRTPATAHIGRMFDSLRRGPTPVSRALPSRTETPARTETPTRTETAAPPPVTEARARGPRNAPLSPDNEPWPTTRAEFQAQFRYSPDRFPDRETYARYVASRVNTPERINQFLENMFVYTTARDQGQRQRIVNGGRNKFEPNEKWINPLEFLTTPDANGNLSGDCDDIALAFAYIAQLQGKQAFALETSTARFVSPNKLQGGGHAMAAWFEPDGSVCIVDTTRSGNRQAGIQVTRRNPGESDEALLTRAYQSDRVGPNPFDASALSTIISMPNGDGFNLPGNLSFIRRHAEIQPMLEAANYRGVLAVVEQEISRDQGNLALRLAKIQLLVLAGAPRAEITAVTSNLSGVGRSTPFNLYAVSTTRSVLLEQNPQYIAEANQVTAHANGGTATA